VVLQSANYQHKSNQTMKVYVIGDSISIQYGPYLEQHLNGIMAYSRKEGHEEASLNLDQPMGANGGDSSMVLSFLKSKAQMGGVQADLILLNCGLHDIKIDLKTGIKQILIDQYQENLREIIRVIDEMKCKLVWVRTTPCDEKVHNHHEMTFHRFAADCEAYNKVADRIMTEAKVPSIDLHNYTIKLDPEPFCDHIHFKNEIREKQAAFIAGWLACWKNR